MNYKLNKFFSVTRSESTQGRLPPPPLVTHDRRPALPRSYLALCPSSTHLPLLATTPT